MPNVSPSRPLNRVPTQQGQQIPTAARLRSVLATVEFQNAKWSSRKPNGFDALTVVKAITVKQPSARPGDLARIQALVIQDEGSKRDQVVFVKTTGQIGLPSRTTLYLGPVSHSVLPR